MSDKNEILRKLKDEYDRWGDMLVVLNHEQIVAPNLASGWSIKDVMAHLWAWQQRTIARMEAARHNKPPEFPQWPAHLDPERDDQTNQINKWIYETSRQKTWSIVYEDWRAGFLHLLSLVEQTPEHDLMAPGRYTWLNGQSLASILLASYDHHEEHLAWFLAT